MSEQYFHTQNLLDLVKEIPPSTIISHTFYEDDRVKAILFGFAPGQELSEHTAARPASLHFLAGEASLTLGDKNFPVQGGSWSFMQPHLPHSIVAKTEVIMLLYLL